MLERLATDGAGEQLRDLLERQNNHDECDLANALAAAAFQGNEDVVLLLLDHGARPDVIPDAHLPALHCAVEQQFENVVRLLAGRGADVNVRSDSGWTPLHLAVDISADSAWQAGETPSTGLISLLLELGADPLAIDGEGQTPIDIAEEYGFSSAVALLRGHTHP